MSEIMRLIRLPWRRAWKNESGCVSRWAINLSRRSRRMFSPIWWARRMRQYSATSATMKKAVNKASARRVAGPSPVVTGPLMMAPTSQARAGRAIARKTQRQSRVLRCSRCGLVKSRRRATVDQRNGRRSGSSSSGRRRRTAISRLLLLMRRLPPIGRGWLGGSGRPLPSVARGCRPAPVCRARGLRFGPPGGACSGGEPR